MLKVLKLKVIKSLRSIKSVKPNGNLKAKLVGSVKTNWIWGWKVLTVSLRSGKVLGN